MTATSHAILGAVIAAKVSNPLLAFPLALLSHIAADLIPHWDTATNGAKKTRRRVFIQTAIDVGIGFLLSYILLSTFFPQTNLVYSFFLILAAQLFDWGTAPYYFFHIKQQPFIGFYKFQKLCDNKLDKPWGIVTQVAFVLSVVLAAMLL